MLVTRPAHQSAALCAVIAASGGRAVPFPAMEIRSVEPQARQLEIFRCLARFDVAIFISANAVRYALPLIGAAGGLPDDLRIAAVGNATAAALTADLRPPDILPGAGFDSQALLDCAELRDVEGTSVLIVRGQGGPPLLGDTLSARGAEVVYAEVYRRACPTTDPTPVLEDWDRIQVVSATSREMLDNLVRIFGSEGRNMLLATPLLVVSGRMAERALDLGFRRVIQARHAGDDMIVEALATHAHDLARDRLGGGCGS